MKCSLGLDIPRSCVRTVLSTSLFFLATPKKSKKLQGKKVKMMLEAIRTAVLGEGYVLGTTSTLAIAGLPGIFTERASYLEVVLALSGSLTAFELYLEYRQLKKDRETAIPAEVLELEILTPQDSDKFRASQEYCVDRRCFGIFKTAVSFVTDTTELLLAPLMYSSLQHSSWAGPEGTLGTFCGKHGIPFELAFFCAYHVVRGYVTKPLSIAFSAYSKFVVEDKHGFNKTTVGTFFGDIVKNEVVSQPLLLGVQAVFYAILKKTGRTAFANLWVFTQVLQVFFLWFYPNYIQPLFNTFTELEEGSLLKKEVQALADRVEYPLYKVFVVDASKRSSHSNAYMFGFGRWKRIVLFDTLMKQPQEELLAILSHELGHWKLGHTTVNMCISSVTVAVMFGAVGAFMYNDVVCGDVKRSFGFAGDTEDVLLRMELASTAVMGSLLLLVQRAMTHLSRLFEFQADNFAVELGYGSALGRALKSLQVDNKGSLNNDWLWAWWNNSHPTTPERLSAIKEALKKGE